MTRDEANAQLPDYNGLRILPRDPKMNSNYPGEFMLVDAGYDPTAGHEQEDGSGGLWCVVSDNLELLVRSAHQLAEFERGS